MVSKTPQSTPKYNKALAITVIVVALFLTSLIIPGISPYTKFPFFFLQCGKNPVIAYVFAGDRWYETERSREYGPDILVTEYFCTEAEAEAAGYRKSVFEH